jgi:hypothetical protein
MGKFSIDLDDKPHLSRLQKTDVDAFKEVVGTFVGLMEVAAEKKWHDLPKAIHSSLSFKDIIEALLNATMTTREMNPEAHAALENDLHPLALLSDNRKNMITGEHENYDWKSHFAVDSKMVSKETVEHIVRKMFYLVRWFSIDEVSKALLAQQFPIVDSKDIQKLPFQPALKYQQKNLGDLHIGKFLHDIGAFNCGEIDKETTDCPACSIGTLKQFKHYKICPRCNSGYTLAEELQF